ncbi:MAG: NUDIX domain-containing protein [Patescibacteria group bacterium]|nr:NUDIX domain-containing protein [Patescibacteria group bacterium]
MNQDHPIQLKILNKLLFAQGLTYSQLKPSAQMENNQFQFHLDQLLKKGWVEKKQKNYSLTVKGKEYASHLDTKAVKIIQQAKISVRICCTREINKEKQYLFYTRLKQPFYGSQGLPAGKVNYGENFVEAAKRELLEETGLTGEPKLALIAHYYVINKATKESMDDKLLLTFIVENPQGKLKGNKEGKYTWIFRKDVAKEITKPFESLDLVKKELDFFDNFNGKIELWEQVHYNSEEF